MRSFVLLVALFIPVSFVHSQVPKIEREALIALYNATDGANWMYNFNWRNGGDTDFNAVGTECTWHGVTCTGSNVFRLTLYSNRMSGSIPPELGNLSSLQELVLSYNQLSGSIPAELCNLSNLQDVSLRSNQLSGNIPAELGNLSNLTYLSLYSNQLSGSIPAELGNLSNLTTLSLSYNQLTGSIPAELGDLSNLDTLYLNDNQLSGSIPAELGNLSNLQWPYLSSNQLSGSIPAELGDLSNLQWLYLHDNQLSGSIPAELGDLANLTKLSLYSNQLTGSIPAKLGNLSNLTRLHLSSNQLSGSIPAELGNLSNLLYLYLHDNQLSGGIPAELGNLSILHNLSLSSNQLSGSIPPELRDLTRLTWDGLNIGYNALWTDDPTLQAFLDLEDFDWDETQTIAPAGINVVSVSDRTAWLEWTPIIYTADHGGYEVFSESVITRAATSEGYTLTKNASTFPVTNLTPGKSFDLTVSTFTREHLNNPQNTVVSELTPPLMATTSNNGCAAPQITVAGNYPYTLTASSHDTYEWSTGETTQSILVRPHWASWYWVNTTDVGGCAEAAVAFAADELLFADDFETGDFSFWSDMEP